MKIRICSDLHIEFWSELYLVKTLEEVLPPMHDDNETVLVLAGDIGLAHRPNTWVEPLKYLASRFKAVVYVEGNHFYYNNNYFGRLKWLRDNMGTKLPDNVHMLEDESVEIDDTVFIGATLWTSLADGEKYYVDIAHRGMMDYRCCRWDNGHYITPEDTMSKFEWSSHYIFDKLLSTNIRSDKPWKTVVVTHHLPSYDSVAPLYVCSPLNPAFASELKDKIKDYKPTLWVHGHTHTDCNYHIESTNMICNPYGYRNQEENTGYNPKLVVNI